MVIPLGETKNRAPEFGGGTLHYYTCKHLTPAGDCAEYEKRPAMCRDYPYGNPCDYAGKGCTYDAPIKPRSVMENVALSFAKRAVSDDA